MAEKKYNLYARDASEENVSFKLFAEMDEKQIDDEYLTKRFAWTSEKMVKIAEIIGFSEDEVIKTLNDMEYLIIEKETGTIVRQFKHCISKKEEN